MGMISSTMKLVDGSTKTIQKTIDSMNKMVDVMEKVNRSADMPELDGMFADVRKEIDLASRELEDFNRQMQDIQPEPVEAGIKSWETSILSANAALDLFQKGLNAAKSAAGFVAGLLEEADTANLGKQQLAVVMANQGATYDDFQNVLAKSDDMQGRTTYGSELFVGAAAELSTYIRSEEAINRLLDSTMADYAAGMGGVNLTYQQMVDYATQLGKALDGTYDGLQKKGFVLDEAQKKIMDTGTEMERVAVLEEIIGESWGGLSEALAATPQGVLQSMNNELAAIRTNMGQELYQEVLNLSQVVTDNLPLIQSLADTAVEVLSRLAGFVADPLLPGIISFGQTLQDTYIYFNENWSTIEPVLSGIATTVGILTGAYIVYKGVMMATAAVESIKAAAQMLSTGATMSATIAQHGLNAAMLANPMVWVIGIIVLLVAALVGLGVWLYKLYQTNVDFRVKVIGIWNNLLAFFDQVPIFFQGIGYGILDAFSYIKVGAAQILQGMINDTIAKINGLIALVNKIPGVSIGAIEGVSFATEIAVQEEAKRQERTNKLQDSKNNAALKAVEREAKLAEDAARWREEAAAKEAELLAEQERLNEEKNKDPYEDLFSGNTGVDAVEIDGGTLDKVGKIGSEVDISNQSLAYLRDIAELQALESVNAYSVVSFEALQEAKLSKADADLLKSSSGGDTKVYYLNYSGGVRINADVKRGDDWNAIRQQMEEEIDNEIESGLSDIDKVVNG